jgi:S1-C subfamily serine protease
MDDEEVAPVRVRALIRAIGRLLPVVGLALLVGLASGVAGGLVAHRLADNDPVIVAPVLSTPAQTESESDRTRTAIARAGPAIVTVLARLPLLPQGDDLVLDRQNLGSGIVIDDRGFVITNYHVVAGAEQIEVVLSTGEVRTAFLVADDSPFQDLAILQIQPGGLRAAPIGDASRLRLGDTVMAVTAGLVDFDLQVKRGVVSALGVDFPRPGFILEGMLQTDAAVNQGDSGGALINLDGEVVGLLTTVVRETPGGSSVDGVALAHSMETLMPVITAVLSTGTNPRARYGIERPDEQHLHITAALAAELELPSRGALLIAVAPGSPAETAGLLAGDLIVAVNGVTISAELTLVTALKAAVVVELSVIRDGEERLIEVPPATLVP